VTKEFSESELVRRDNGAMHLDLIGLRWNGKTIRKSMSGQRSILFANFRRIFVTRLANSLLRCKQFRGELFAKTQLDFRRFHGVLDRLPRFPLLTQLSFAGQSLLLIALLSELLWDRIADKTMTPPRKAKGNTGSPGMIAKRNMSRAATDKARGYLTS